VIVKKNRWKEKGRNSDVSRRFDNDCAKLPEVFIESEGRRDFQSLHDDPA
jgi:hypothetical protein